MIFRNLFHSEILSFQAQKSVSEWRVEKKIERPDGLEHADWAGFFIDDRYLIGCGMDSEEKYRHYPGIAVLG